MRFKVLIIASIAAAAFAACASQSGTPVTPALANGSSPAAATPSTMQTVTAADVAEVRNFRGNRAHFTGTGLGSRFGAHAAPPVKYPLDMTEYGGPTMPSSKAYNVYVNCPNESCWGHPEEFLRGLQGSDLAGVITQYTGGKASAYGFAGSMSVKYNHPYTNTYDTEDLFAILAAALRHFKATGLTAQYHIFLPKGIDTCFEHTNLCYSPDDLQAFQFCAYHGSVLYHKQPVIYSIEPYQNVQFDYGGQHYYACQELRLPPGVDRLDSDTASTLSHESFEAWSDPVPNSGWYNARYQAEIGDVCAYGFREKAKFGKNSYYVQTEYSNQSHGCAGSS